MQTEQNNITDLRHLTFQRAFRELRSMARTMSKEEFCNQRIRAKTDVIMEFRKNFSTPGSTSYKEAAGNFYSLVNSPLSK